MDRTEQQIRAYLEAMPCEEYRLRLIPVHKENRPHSCIADAQGVVKRVAYMKAINAKGYQVYARPLSYQYVLLDDLPPDTLQAVQELRPCVVMMTSPNNYQAWLKLRETPASRPEALAICQHLAERFGADRGSAEPDHLGRLPGYTNRKPQYQKPNGYYPFVSLVNATVQTSTFYPLGGLCSTDEPAPLSNGSMNGATMNAPKPIPKHTDFDRSRADFNRACMLIRQRKTDEEIRADLEQFSEKAQGRKDDYIGRTIRNARRVVVIN